MKILQIGKFYFPSHGGIESVLRDLSEGLVARGHDVTVLCATDRFRGTFAATEETIGGVKVIRVPKVSTLFSQPLTPTLPGALRRLALESRIVHLHSPNPIAEASLLALGIRPDVVTYHSDVVRQKALLPLYRPLILRLLARAGTVVAASENLRRSSPLLREISERTRVVPFGLPPERFSIDAETRRRSAEIFERYGNFVIFVGRLVGYKGLDLLIDAMETAKETSLIVIGEGPLRPELETRAVAGSAGGRIIFKGRVESAGELKAYLHASQALVLPSVSENEAFGVVLLEAMACGRATIATRLDTGVSEVVDDGRTGLLVPPGDREALSQAIQKIVENPMLSAELGANGAIRFRERFTLDRMLDGYESIYSEAESARATTGDSTASRPVVRS